MINLSPAELAAMISERPYKLTVDGVITRFADRDRAERTYRMVRTFPGVTVTRNWM